MKGRQGNASLMVLLLALLVALAALAGCGEEAGEVDTTTTVAEAESTTTTAAETGATGEPGTLTIYSGRSEDLIAPLIADFQEATGIETKVRYGDTAELAGTILEEGSRSPADLFFAQDAGALGALAKAGRLQPLSENLLEPVDARFRSAEGLWVGLSGRARTLVYNTEVLTEADLPSSIMDLTDPKWKGKIGWAPSNGSFQAFVTALRVTAGEDAARDWLQGVQANEPKVYEKNTAIVEAVGNREVEVGLVNHYYLFRILKEKGEGFPVANYFFPGEDIGNLVNVAGAGILDTAANTAAAEEFIRFALSEEAQQYFSQETTEYPLVNGVAADPRLKPLSDINTPEVDLANLDDLEQTLNLLQELNIL